MALLTRLLTDAEKGELLMALPTHLKPLVEVLRSISPCCWECQQFTAHPEAAELNDMDLDRCYCTTHGKIVEMDKRKGHYDCYEYRFDAPF